MPRGQGGGRKPKYNTPESRNEARRVVKRAYDHSEKRKFARRSAKARSDEKIAKELTLKNILNKAFKKSHPLSLSLSYLRRVPHRFAVANPSKRTVVALPHYLPSNDAFHTAWSMHTRLPSVSGWYRNWLDGPLYRISDEAFPKAGAMRSMSFNDIQSALDGWWVRKIVAFFASSYSEMEKACSGAATDTTANRSVNENWKQNTLNLLMPLESMWSELAEGYAWVEKYFCRPFEEAFHKATKSKEMFITRRYIWWRYHHVAFLRNELRQRYKYTYEQLQRDVKRGRAAWQREWCTRDSYTDRKIYDLWRHYGEVEESSDGSDGGSSSDGLSYDGDNSS